MTDVTRLYSFRMYDSVREIPYESIIIVEPAIVDCETFQASPSGCAKLSAVNKAVAQRPRDWESREEAHRWFRKRVPWKTWQQQVFDIYIVRFGHHTEKMTWLTHAQRDGLRPVEPGSSRVTVKCDHEHEARVYVQDGSMFPAVDQIARVCPVIPMHAVRGAQNDYMYAWKLFQPYIDHLFSYSFKASNDCITDTSKGRRMASVSVIPDAGHSVRRIGPSACDST